MTKKDYKAEVQRLRETLRQSEHVQTELDRRVFYLKTLYDVSKDIFSSVESETILRNFLLMAMGNFGVTRGFILTLNSSFTKLQHLVQIGLEDDHVTNFKNGIQKQMQKQNIVAPPDKNALHALRELLPPSLDFIRGFHIEKDCTGIFGLGAKLIGEPYDENDEELLDTLVNNLIVALKNARSFEEIKELNEALVDKNEQLEKALIDLKKALRKVEILEDVKANLSKFVPSTVTHLIEKSPNGVIPESKEQDVSVLFLDIEGYTTMCEQLQGAEVNEVIEKCFSVFMDAIFANNGDVNETAGDGLMVLFLDEDKQTNALEAVRTALKIKEEAARIKNEFRALSQPLTINMGINSGPALVGAAKFESYTGSRWTYTARGIVTNIAARIGAQATQGKIFLSEATAKRVKDHFTLTSQGKFDLKNVSRAIEIFQI